MNWRGTPVMILVVAVTLAGCSVDPTTSDEYRAVEQELAASEQQLAEQRAELSAALVALEDLSEAKTVDRVPADVAAVIDGWWAANERADGSVVDLYEPTGYHLYGDQKISLENLAGHLNAPGYTAEWIAEPHLIAAEPAGRYVVTRGIRTSSGGMSFASALTFEIVTMPDGDLKIAHSDFAYVEG